MSGLPHVPCGVPLCVCVCPQVVQNGVLKSTYSISGLPFHFTYTCATIRRSIYPLIPLSHFFHSPLPRLTRGLCYVLRTVGIFALCSLILMHLQARCPHSGPCLVSTVHSCGLKFAKNASYLCELSVV